MAKVHLTPKGGEVVSVDQHAVVIRRVPSHPSVHSGNGARQILARPGSRSGGGELWYILCFFVPSTPLGQPAEPVPH